MKNMAITVLWGIIVGLLIVLFINIVIPTHREKYHLEYSSWETDGLTYYQILQLVKSSDTTTYKNFTLKRTCDDLYTSIGMLVYFIDEWKATTELTTNINDFHRSFNSMEQAIDYLIGEREKLK